jgi:hypothetical protein
MKSDGSVKSSIFHKFMHERKEIMKRTILIGLVLTVFLFGCVAGIGTTEQSEQPTVGKELIDLKTALDKGALTEKEYFELKQKVMNRKQ